MLILDRYLLRQFLQVFVICFCSMTGLFVVIDGFGNLEEFISYADKRGNLLVVMGDFYAYQALSFFDRTSGILTLIAAMFTVTWIQRHHELTAIEAAGIRKARVVKPVIYAVIAISLLAAANRELLIPNVKEKLNRKARDLSGGTAKMLQARYDHETDVLFQTGQLIDDTQVIRKAVFLLPTPLSHLGKQLTAEEAFYFDAAGERPRGYLLKNVELPRKLDTEPSLRLGKRLVVVTPKDAPWLQPGECYLVSDVRFDQLDGGQAWRQFSSTLTLIRELGNRSLDFGADVRVTIHNRLVQPLLDVTLLFLGIPLVLVRGNRNIFVAIGMCVAVVIAFVMVVLGCQYLGTSGLLSPSLSAWLPLMIFVPGAIGLAEPLWE